MAVAVAKIETFRGQMVRDTVLAYVDRLMSDGIDKDEAVTQTVAAIIEANRSADFVRAFGGTAIKGMLTSRQAPKHPAARPTPDDTLTPQYGGGGGRPLLVPHTQDATPPPIPQTFPDPGTGRVMNLTRLRDPRPLTGMLAGTWVVDGQQVALGLLTAEQCFKLAESEMRRGKTHVTNGTMFRRLGQSLSPGEVVADRWDEAGIRTHFELAEPKL